MSDCGVNLVGFVRPQLLDACKKYKLKALVFDESISGEDYAIPYDAKLADNLPALIKKVNKHPAVYGYHIKDEPGAGEFPALAHSVAKVKELAPGKWPYINLYPGMGADYDNYLEQFVKICKPTILSYDNYPLGEDGKFSYGFWVNIAQMRAAALKHDLPFWNIILTAPHWNYRELTQADLRLQMYGSLVYGAKGISFYKFISASLPILKAPDLGNFRMAPLDQFGEKTATWGWLRNVNDQVQNIGPTMLKLRSDDVYHIGDYRRRAGWSATYHPAFSGRHCPGTGSTAESTSRASARYTARTRRRDLSKRRCAVGAECHRLNRYSASAKTA
jgi:hypothetical protein